MTDAQHRAWKAMQEQANALREFARTSGMCVVVPKAPPVTYERPSSKDDIIIVDDFTHFP